MEFNTIKIVHTDSGYRVMVDGEPYYCESLKELTDFLEGIGA
jgi:hypothetical protein